MLEALGVAVIIGLGAAVLVLVMAVGCGRRLTPPDRLALLHGDHPVPTSAGHRAPAPEPFADACLCANTARTCPACAPRGCPTCGRALRVRVAV